MSILLDSLRKSEAQRNAGGTPTIYSTQGYGDSGDSNRRWVVWLLLGLTAVAIIWFGWRQYSPPDITGTSAQTVTEEAPATSAGRQTGTDQVSDAGISAANRTPVERLSQAPGSNPAQSDEAAANVLEANGTAAEKIADFVAEEEVGSEIADPQGSAELAAQDSLGDDELTEEVLAEEDSAQNPTQDPEQGRVMDRPLQSRLSQTDPPRSEPKDEPISYWQLQQGLRNELPEFKITVLVFAEAAEDRFLLMNGERLREKDELDGGVTLEEIRRDGAVFSYQSRRFLVKN